MNERIRELWRDCVLKHTNDPMNWQMAADEFAELIVEECATVIEKNLFQGIGWNTSRAVRRHFGIGDEE